MSPRKKKDPAKQAAEDATVRLVQATVAEDPRGAPETLPRETPDGTHMDAPVQPVVLDLAPVTPPVTPERPPERPCAIENAVDGAKCVVSRTETGKTVRLLSPQGVVTLDPDDLCYTLPASAKIRRVNATTYEAYRLGVVDGPLFTAPSAREAVARFLEVVT